MKGLYKILSFCLVALLAAPGLQAKENIGVRKAQKRGLRTSAACSPSSSSTELDVNNVRCILHNGGDMWWDLVGNPRYEVPKVDDPASARHSSFAGSLWIGGVDESGQLRVAAQTYRQSGNDFWPGPLTDGGASVDDVICEQWDKHFKIEKAEIDAFRAAFIASSGGAVNLDDYPNVKNWPAFGEDLDGNRLPLAPFVDVDGDPFNYTPEAGDYPDISPVEGGGEPDQAVWWVINDKGDVHTETGGEPIGLEIQMLAFAFNTANAINDMTFYKYKVINKSTLTLTETFMGQWVDADIGQFSDDYVGCDTSRGLGFAYNGDADDEGATGYGANPPAFGMDFFQGPIGDNGERIKMTRFVYYENDFSLRGNPEVATHFYGYLRGFWKDGSRMVDNGTNGFPATGSGPVTNFMYPGDAGFCGGTASGWSEVSAGNQPFDRRFVQSAGPFTLVPGAVNDIVTGAVWTRGFYNDNLGSVCELFTADDIAQALFDAGFQRLSGPDAPDVAIEEYDQELVLSWGYENDGLKNNYDESYIQSDPVLVSQGVRDSLFQFEGYIVYQLRNNAVSISDLNNSELARIVAQCDLKNGVSTIINRTTTTVPGLPDPVIVDEIMVQGADDGIINSVRTTEDLFAAGDDRRLKNYTTYYYGVLAYAYNDTASDGKKFLPGDRFFTRVSAVPHKINFENFGTVTNANYGDGLPITQISGVGNGGNVVQIDEATESAILSSPTHNTNAITYQQGASPVTVKIVNPKEVIAGNYRLDLVRDQFEGTIDTIGVDTNGVAEEIDSTFIEWILYENNAEIARSTYIKRQIGNSFTFRPEPFAGTERVIKGHGISIAVEDVVPAGDTLVDPVLSATVTYDDPLSSWLSGVPDDDDFATWNWILSGDDTGDRGHDVPKFKRNFVFDKEEHFEDVLGGIWSPFCLVRGFVNGDPAGVVSPGVLIEATPNVRNLVPEEVVDMNELPDVDIVLTNDSTKWSKCVVIETTPAQNLGSGAWPMALRYAKGVNKDGSEFTSDPLDESNQGWGWFPGYAINVNTGQRLNIFFGESSWDKQNNGDDMQWNPTSSFGPAGSRVGGRHFIYVTTQPYDGCVGIHDTLSNTNFTPVSSTSQLFLDPTNAATDMRAIYNQIAWVGIPMLNGSLVFNTPDSIPTETRVSLRVNQPWRSREGTNDIPAFTFSTEDFAAALNLSDVAKDAMEDIRIVPNPYYAYSRYEQSQIQTTVKLTNLPQKAKIRIFTLNGTLVRTYNKDSDEPDQNWDLKNSNGVPVASGVYIIHVDGFDLGEKIVKFFAVMPEIDLNSF